jgi:hypothetical protein
MRRLALALLLLLPAACQPLPQPFADDRPPPGSPLLTLKDSGGIKVEPVVGAGGEAGPRLAEAMAAALRDQDVPASTDAGNRAGYRLIGSVVEKNLPDGRAAVDLAWELLGPDGSRAGSSTQHAEAPAAAWWGGDETVLAEIAKGGAPRIAALVQEEAPVEAPSAAPPVVAVRAVEGAPGDGSQALTRAMTTALKMAKLGIADEAAQGAAKGAAAKEAAPNAAGAQAFVVAGRVDVTRPVEGKQQVKIVWSVLTAAGGEIGKVSQENAVPAGSLDGRWGDIAYAVATAASDGIVAILEKAREQPPS